jgi:signal transduction histidine kinase
MTTQGFSTETIFSRWGHWGREHSPKAAVLFATAGVFLVGFLDFMSGNEISWSVVYALPIAVATWYGGPAWAYALAVLSVALWIAGESATGIRYSSWLVPVWNSTIRLAFYYAFIGMLFYIRSLTGDLERRVLARTADLERLERELLEVGERERRRIGADLHDGLGQHLTGTSLAAQVLRKQLLKRGHSEAQQAGEIVTLIEEGITLSHKLAKGLQPVEMHAGGLMQALQDFAASANDLFKIACQFRCDAPILISDVTAAEHLYRIAQEATNNAVKHGHAANIVLSLEADDEGVLLQIKDDGVGFVYPVPANIGLGLRIMEKRAKLIGARFGVESRPARGTIILCHLPLPAVESRLHA